MKKVLIIIPTYNESENIVKLIRKINSLPVVGFKIDILIIDDNSIDGTSKLVKDLNLENVNVIDREKRWGSELLTFAVLNTLSKIIMTTFSRWMLISHMTRNLLLIS